VKIVHGQARPPIIMAPLSFLMYRRSAEETKEKLSIFVILRAFLQIHETLGVLGEGIIFSF